MFIRLQGSGCSAFLSSFLSPGSLFVSLLSFVSLLRSFYLQCFLLRSSPSNVHLSRASDEELIAPESLALLLVDGRTRRGAIFFVRSNVASRIDAPRIYVRVYALGALARVYQALDIYTFTVAPDPETQASRSRPGGESLDRQSPQDLFAGQGCRGRRRQCDCNIIVQTESFPLSLFLSLPVFPSENVGCRIKIAITGA